MTYMLIDIGNTNAKYTFYDSNVLSSINIIPTFRLEKSIDALDLGGRKTLQKIIFVSVIDDNQTSSIVNAFTKIFDCPVQQVKSSKENFGVRCGYSDFSLLGADRWVGLVAGFNHIKEQQCNTPVLVIDCGTVVTADLIDNEGLHLGGWMMPGSALMRDALINKSSGIKRGMEPLATHQNLKLMIGQSTSECVDVGGKLAEIGFIEQCYTNSKKIVGSTPSCILTGGGAKDLLSLLNISVDYLPELVFDGLALFIE